jgi:hypothetical protein
MKENDGGMNSTMKYCKNLANVTMYPQHKNDNF